MTVARTAGRWTHCVVLSLLVGAPWHVSAQEPSSIQSREGIAPAIAPFPIGQCEQDLPLDAGSAFAGPRFLIFGNRLLLFERDFGKQAGTSPKWKIVSEKKGRQTPDSSGITRARLKWREETLWRKDSRPGGTRILAMDRGSGNWLIKADLDLEFNDFDVDLEGRILLIGTADPATQTYRALVERVLSDHKSPEILHPYPQKIQMAWFDKMPPTVAAALVSNYESVQIGEFIILFNPMARRIFVLNAYNDSFREATLGWPAQTPEGLIAGPKGKSDPFDDLCWQILPKSDSEAWIIRSGGLSPKSATEEHVLQAIALNLTECKCEESPVNLQGLRLPVFFNPSGHLVKLQDALDEFGNAHSEAMIPKVKPSGSQR